MSVFVVRAFVKLRDTLATHKELAEKMNELERKVGTHGRAIVSILATLRQMTDPADKKGRAIGFRAKRDAVDNRTKQKMRMRKKSQQPSELAKQALKALRRAAKQAHRIAAAYGTPVYVEKNGKIIALKPKVR